VFDNFTGVNEISGARVTFIALSSSRCQAGGEGSKLLGECKTSWLLVGRDMYVTY